MDVILNSTTLFSIKKEEPVFNLKLYIAETLNLCENDFYLIQNGKVISHTFALDTNVHIVPRIFGGKGGFGSMLRAIGAQIEKTTNREACRDLSGRRLRDINEEQRLKNWIAQQADRERETAERKKKKLEKLCEEPKHVFQDEKYHKEREELTEKVEDAVLYGLQASCSTKRKSEEPSKNIKKKKPKLWVDEEFDDLGSSECEDSEDDTASETKKTSKDVKQEEDKILSQDSQDSEESVKTQEVNNEEKEDETSKK